MQITDCISAEKCDITRHNDGIGDFYGEEGSQSDR
jgi:hypothetical protein